MEEIITKEIMAIIPIYIEDKGNCTIIYTKKGNVQVYTTIRTVIKKLCAHYRLDVKASNRHFGGLISIKNAIPLPLTRDNIFIQVKVRKPIGKDDGSMGYFNMDAIKKIKGLKGDASILLKNGYEIQCLCSHGTIKKHIKHGELIKSLYGEGLPKVNEAMEYYIAQDTPATKSDIARIFMMIQDIVNKIK